MKKLILSLFICLLPAILFAKIGGEVSLVSCDGVGQFYSKTNYTSEMWDWSIEWFRININNVDTKNRLTVWNDLWIHRPFYLEFEIAYDFATLYNRSLIILGYCVTINNSWNIDVGVGALLQDKTYFNINAKNIYTFDLWQIVDFKNIIDLNFPLSAIPLAKIESKIGVRFFKIFILNYTNLINFENEVLESTNRVGLAYEF